MEDTFDAWYIDNMEDDHDYRPGYAECEDDSAQQQLDDEFRRDMAWYFSTEILAPSSFPPPF